MKNPPATSRRTPAWLRPFARLGRLLTLQLRVKRRGLACRLVVEPERAPQPAVPAAATGDMQAELTKLLGRHPQSRQLLRHLGYVEHVLRRRGTGMPNAVPLHVLETALTQFSQLAPQPVSPGLVELRLHLTTLVADKQEAAHQPGNNVLSDFNSSQRVQVSEATASVFEALQKDWTA